MANEREPEHGPREVLRRYIAQHGLKASRQREIVADVFFRAGGHVRVDELLERVRQVDPRISQATVYRTMKLLRECGLAAARRFSEGETLYESSAQGSEHHDHLICTGCGRIVEFVNERIEQLQRQVARDHGFAVTAHKLELYGLCSDCLAKEAAQLDDEPQVG